MRHILSLHPLVLIDLPVKRSSEELRDYMQDVRSSLEYISPGAQTASDSLLLTAFHDQLIGGGHSLMQLPIEQPEIKGLTLEHDDEQDQSAGS